MASRRKLSYRLDGTKVVRTLERYDEDGELESRDVLVEGEKDVVLAQLEKHLAEAKKHLDGVKAKAPESPPPATASPGKRDTRYYVKNGVAFEEELRYDHRGNLQKARARSLGLYGNALEHAKGRYEEILDNRNKVRDAR